MQPRKIAFRRIADAALGHADAIVQRWLPDGRREGHEWVARNPKRADRRPGSFKVNLRTGRWGDFSTGDKGGDLVALAAFLFSLNQADAAFLFSLNQADAAKSVAAMLGINPYE